MTNKKNNFAMIAFTVMIVATVLLRVIFKYLNFDGMVDEARDYYWSFFSQIISIGGLPLLVVLIGERVKPKALFREMGYAHSPKWWVYLICAAMVPLILIVSTGFGYITNIFILLFGGALTSSPVVATDHVGLFLMSIVATAVLPALFEELLNRGIVLRGLKDHFKDTSLAVMGGLFFALMHTNIQQTLYTFVFGILLSLLAIKLKSIWPCILIHFGNNALCVWEDYALANGWFGSNMFSTLNNFTDNLLSTNLGLAAALWILACGAVIALVWVCIRFGARTQSTETTPQPMTTPAQLSVTLDRRNVTALRNMDRLTMVIAITAGTVFTLFTLFSRMI